MMPLKIYKISQKKNDNWNTYVSAIVCAVSEDEAKLIHPDASIKGDWWKDESNYDDWVSPEDVIVEEIGTTDKLISGEVVCSNNTGA
ncbi:MAG: hypothetical protein ACRDD5_01080 [Silvania sp.]|uniref:hypothetical protein n=1 Tax=Silvania sp. TaxID=3016633 RepID=UPI003EE81A04